MMVAMFVFSACSPSHKGEVDELNYLSYALHYRNLDSTKVLAEKALALSEDYPAGYAEACNNLAFVAIAKMDYHTAKRWLDKVNERSLGRGGILRDLRRKQKAKSCAADADMAQ